MSNLKPFTKENASEMGRKGGQISARRRKDFQHMSHTLRELMVQGMSLPENLEGMVPKSMEKGLSVQEVLLLEQVRKALDGDTRALSFLRDTMGESPQHNGTLMNGLQEMDIDMAFGTSSFNSFLGFFRHTQDRASYEDGDSEDEGDGEEEILSSLGETSLRYILATGHLEDVLEWEEAEEEKDVSPDLEDPIEDLIRRSGAEEIIEARR